MKTTITCFFLLIAITFFSCSSYTIKDDKSISGIKKSGLIFRLSNGSKISQEEIANNTLYWLNNFEKNSGIVIIRESGDSLSFYKYSQERFYQLSNEKKFLKYKSIGMLNLYLQRNRSNLLRIMTENSLDSIIIYEIYNIISTEMQFLDYDTVIAISDKNLNIIYLDHCTDHIETNSTQLEELKSYMMDELDEKLAKTLQDLNILGRRSDKTGISSEQSGNTAKEDIRAEDNTDNDAASVSGENTSGASDENTDDSSVNTED